MTGTEERRDVLVLGTPLTKEPVLLVSTIMNSIIETKGEIPTKIALQTRKGKNIPNDQFHELNRYDHWTNRKTKKEFSLLGVKFLTSPNPIYNCYGLIFASRRTGIYDDTILPKILEDDGYTEIPCENVSVGDIVIYFYNNSPAHVGLVIHIPISPPPCLPMILSKWGRGVEAVHQVNVHPYQYGDMFRYYRMTK